MKEICNYDTICDNNNWFYSQQNDKMNVLRTIIITNWVCSDNVTDKACWKKVLVDGMILQ